MFLLFREGDSDDSISVIYDRLGEGVSLCEW